MSSLLSANGRSRNGRPAISRRAASLVSVALVASVLATVAGADNISAEVPADHGVLAPTIPRTDLPIVLDGEVLASAQFGDKVVVGGNFTQIRLQDNSVVNRQFLFAYDINTGAYLSSFDPVIDREVEALETADDGSGLFIAGKFNTVDGISKRKVAKLDVNGEVLIGFTANADAKVTTIDDDGQRLYLGGAFTTINNQPRIRLAAVDITDGTVSSFRNDVTVDVGRNTGSVKTVDVSPDNSLLLVVHASALVDGLDRFGVAQIDLNTDQVTPWRTDWYKFASPRCTSGAFQPRDAEFSPDGSFFVIVEKGHYRCDKAIAFPTANGPGLEENLWVLQAFDSVYSVGISDVAVYVGGHFCFLDQLGPIATAQASTYPYVNKPQGCQSGGNEDTNGVAARYQIGAVIPSTGELHAWNPGTNVQEAVFDIEIIDRGLLLGLDRDRVNNILTGRQAFLDFGGLTPPPDPPLTDICTLTPVANGVQLDWTIVDANPSVVNLRRDGSWLATVTSPATTYTDLNGPPNASYLVRYRVAGTVVDVTCTAP